ncbi:MAG: RluA family pseudouridine synthase [Myxococcota bacterium]
MSIRVVHHDESLLVVDKPSGLATTAPEDGDSLATKVKALDPEAPRLHPTSRLDAEVTGLVTFARTRRATLALKASREEGRYHRLYLALALAEGLPGDAGRWEGTIAIDPRDPRRRFVGEGKGAKAAATRWSVVARAGQVVLLAFEPETGRTHQLRVHAQAAGVPLLGDRHYGGARRVTQKDGRVLSARRVMLHCAALMIGGEVPLDVTSVPPKDFHTLWTGAGGDATTLAASAAIHPR